MLSLGFPFEAKSNEALTTLEDTPICSTGAYGADDTYQDLINSLLGTFGTANYDSYSELYGTCEYNQYKAIDNNNTEINSNSSNITSNTSNITSNTSNINNLGEGVAGSTALTAALTALPQTSKDSKLSCGVGTGAYSSRYALSFGCASKLNERVDLNAGGSYVFGGSKSYGGGTLDSGVVKAGFVFKLGELNKPTQISFNDKKIINKKISDLEINNKNLKAKNDEIISLNQKLLARLENLENIALKFQSSSEIISVATKD